MHKYIYTFTFTCLHAPLSINRGTRAHCQQVANKRSVCHARAHSYYHLRDAYMNLVEIIQFTAINRGMSALTNPACKAERK